jgi:hypothetical protein
VIRPATVLQLAAQVPQKMPGVHVAGNELSTLAHDFSRSFSSLLNLLLKLYAESSWRATDET